MCVCVCIYIYIYSSINLYTYIHIYLHTQSFCMTLSDFSPSLCIYIYCYPQTVSLYHNSSVWLDREDASSWDRNPADFMLVRYLIAQPSAI